MADLNHITVACVATDGFEYVELVEPKKALEEAGAIVRIVSPKEDGIRGMKHLDWHGDPLPVDEAIDDASPEDYDALLLPGGVANPDALRLSEKTLDFIRHFVEAGKPIAAICHGPWTLIDADGVSGKRMTSWPSIRRDLENAGVLWADEEVIVDGMLVTSRKPDDIPAFSREMIMIFAKAPARRPKPTLVH